MTTAQTIIDRVFDQVDDSNTGFYTTARVLDWINEAQRNIARRTEAFQKQDTVAVTSGTQEYTLPTDIIRLHRVEYQITGQTQNYVLLPREYNAMDEVSYSALRSMQSDKPYTYTLWGYPPALKIILFPTPSTSGTLTVFYYALPTDVTTTGSTVFVPSGWEDLVVDYVEMKGLRKARDPRWQEAKAEFEQKLDMMIQRTQAYHDQGSRFVTTGGVGPLPAWLVNGDW